ncbi:glutaminase liver isoform, mitochondrial-like [Homalodisca vitripennis]|uniref:glutaminase liver isoform, mitochondrial-like n=1 Tax=Homalodisca vitripennis TaxID=197043 RepID=UPI001EEBB5E7|nr:glutaminase liver isoform, mitochondrial-like [Homalodisca vitripennis]
MLPILGRFLLLNRINNKMLRRCFFTVSSGMKYPKLQFHFQNMSTPSILHAANYSREMHEAVYAPPDAEFYKSVLTEVDHSTSFDSEKTTEDVWFEIFREEGSQLVNVGKFLAALQVTGLRKNDPRLKEFYSTMRKLKISDYEDRPSETVLIDRNSFKSLISTNLELISQALRHNFVIPDFPGFTKRIEQIFWKCKDNISGHVASYIPQLARMSPDYWGVSVCTVDGQRFSLGDTNIPFTIQSCSKPLSYGIALDNLGQQTVHQYVGHEPSGRIFNELILDNYKKPHNPMINAGAILVCSLLKTLVKPDLTAAEKFDFTMDYYKRLAGGEHLGFNNATFLSEREAAHRNYALAHYMREHNCYPPKTNLQECLDFYFQICSLEVSCESMSVIAATLANSGVCPTTEDPVLFPDSIHDVLSLMHSCGMYDYSGQFAFKVGLPAKSGVCGGMLIVIPNVMGICTWSPPLDQLGNSCRGVQFCEEMVRVFNFHRFDNHKHNSNKKDPQRHKYETHGLNIVNLLFTAARGDYEALCRYRLSGMNMALADYDGRTSLHLAAAEGHYDCVVFLVEQCGVPINSKDRWGKTALDEAIFSGHNKVAQFLEDWEKNSSAESEVKEMQ